MFPDGNSGIARLIMKTLIPESIGGEHSLEDVCRKNGELRRARSTAGRGSRSGWILLRSG